MSKEDRRLLIIGIITAVVGGGIVAIVFTDQGAAVFDAICSSLVSLVVFCWDILVKSLIGAYSVPGWVLFPLTIITAYFLLSLLMAVQKKWSRVEPPLFTRYVEDFLFDAKWHWSWREGAVKNLHSFCPSCEGQLIYDDSNCDDIYEDHCDTKLICENCDYKIISTIRGYAEEALARVEREILRRVRVGEYPSNISLPSQ
ncbi:hypothetical protein [Microbulbifer sp. TRSA005]|uniref:hypothetical protein n=1 Tax=Microbulbifer sp. TRSA005 TaxID=3243383 RepID=UPI004039AAB3